MTGLAQLRPHASPAAQPTPAVDSSRHDAAATGATEMVAGSPGSGVACGQLCGHPAVGARSPQRVEVSYTFFKQQVEADNVVEISTRARGVAHLNEHNRNSVIGTTERR